MVFLDTNGPLTPVIGISLQAPMNTGRDLELQQNLSRSPWSASPWQRWSWFDPDGRASGCTRNKLLDVIGRPRIFFFSSRRRHTICGRDWSSDVCSSDLTGQ